MGPGYMSSPASFKTQLCPILSIHNQSEHPVAQVRARISRHQLLPRSLPLPTSPTRPRIPRYVRTFKPRDATTPLRLEKLEPASSIFLSLLPTLFDSVLAVLASPLIHAGLLETSFQALYLQRRDAEPAARPGDWLRPPFFPLMDEEKRGQRE